MIELKINDPFLNTDKSSPIHCPNGHKLIKATHDQRKRGAALTYSNPGFCCDQCLTNFPLGISWHCSCTNHGFDKCSTCMISELYNFNDPFLTEINEDTDLLDEIEDNQQTHDT